MSPVGLLPPMYQFGTDFELSLGSSTANAVPDASLVPQPRLVRAAHEFEAAMMQELMAPLLPGHDPLNGEDTGSSSALSAFAGEALGQALSERGGFGIANRIIRQLTTASNHSGKTPVLKSRGGSAAKVSL